MDEDYDIYGGAPWSAYHDDVDPYELEAERRAEEQAHLEAEAYADAEEELRLTAAEVEQYERAAQESEDSYWQEHDREVATPGFGILADADARFFDNQERWASFHEMQDEYQHGLGEIDGGEA